MPGYSINSLAPEPILLLTLSDEWDLSTDVTAFVRDWRQALEATGGPQISIVDVHSLGLPGLEDLAVAANQTAHGQTAMIHHRALHQMLIVSTNAVLNRCMHGQHPDTFGDVHVAVYGSVEEALAQAHAAA